MAIALALSACGAFLGSPAAHAQASPDSGAAGRDTTAVTIPLASPLDTLPGRSVEAYGPASDSVVRARCEGAVIRRVDIHCMSIFDPVPESRFSPVYSGANRLHVRTREATVRSQLLVAPGQLWTADRISESQRLLRDLEYIEPEVIRSRLVDDSVDVLVITHDQWTTQPELNIERGGGLTYGSVGLTERNMMGLGLAVSLAFHSEPAGRSRSFALTGERLFGSQLEAQAKASTGTAGVSNSYYVLDPFRSLDDTRSWTASWSRADADQFLYENGLISARFPFAQRIAQAEAAWGRRTTDGVVHRVAVGMAMHDRHYGPTSFSPTSTIEVASGEEELKLRWSSLRYTLWRPHYMERRGIELMDPVEDFDVGELMSLEGGLAMRALGSTADEGIAKVRLNAGHETRRFGFGLLRMRFSTRLRRVPVETLAQVDGRWIQQPGRALALVVAAHGEVAADAPREVQSTVGGLNGLRAYGVQALAGTQIWRFNGEARWTAARDVFDLASVGGAAFVDAARAWGTGSDNAPWHHDAGFGLRLAFPHASLHQVARFDVAFPLSPTRDGRRSPVFSFGSSQAF
jgi:hypothetical protein